MAGAAAGEGGWSQMDGENEAVGSGAGVRVARRVVPWMALVAVLLTLMTVWSGFQASLKRVAATLPDAGSVAATGSASASATPVVAAVAVTRVAGVALRSAPVAEAKVLLTVKKGATLEVLKRSDTWLQVREPDGLIGWTENAAQKLEIRNK